MRTKPRPWTTAEEAYVKLHFGTKPVADIAAELNRKKPMVYSKANDMGLYIRGKNKPNVLDAVKSLYQSAF